MSKMTGSAERLARALEAGQQAAARVTAGKPVQIRYDQEQGAFVDTRTGIIHLPPLGNISEDAVDTIRGLADHEAGHMGHTDMEIFNEVCEDAKKKSKEKGKEEDDDKVGVFGGIEHTYFNAIEDNRCDKKSSEGALGVARNLDWLRRHFLYKKDLLSTIDEKFGEDERVKALALISMEANFKGTEHEDFVREEATRLSEVYPHMRKYVEEELDRIPSLGSTKEVLDLSHEIVGKLKEFIRKEDEITGGGKGKGTGEGAGEEEGEGKGTGEGDDWEEGVEEKFEKGMASIGNGSTIYSGAMFDELGGEIDKSRKVERDDRYDEPFIPYLDGDREVDLYKCKDLTEEYKRHRGSTSSLLEYGFQRWNEQIVAQRQGINVMRRRLLIDLLGRVKKFIDNQEVGQINDRHLWRTALGDKNIFRRKQKQVAINAAVTLLVDCSGSMSGEKIHIASDTAIIMAETLDLVGVPFEVLGFNQVNGDFSYEDVDRMRELGYTRVYPMSHYIFKSFEQNLDKRCKSLIGAIPHIHLYENVDGESVRWAARRIALRKEDRRILIVISDGYPAGYAEYDLHNDLKTVCQTIEQSGQVSLFGIGVCSDAPKEYYKDHAIIDDPAQLVTTAYDKISTFLKGSRIVKVR